MHRVVFICAMMLLTSCHRPVSENAYKVTGSSRIYHMTKNDKSGEYNIPMIDIYVSKDDYKIISGYSLALSYIDCKSSAIRYDENKDIGYNHPEYKKNYDGKIEFQIDDGKESILDSDNSCLYIRTINYMGSGIKTSNIIKYR